MFFPRHAGEVVKWETPALTCYCHPSVLWRWFSLRWCWGGHWMALCGARTSEHGRPGRRFVFREADCPVYRAQKKWLSLTAKGRSRTQLRRLRQPRDYSRLSGRRRSRARACRGREWAAGSGWGGGAGAAGRVFPCATPGWSDSDRKLPARRGPGAEPPGRRDPRRPGRAEPPGGGTDRQTDGLLPPPGSAAPGAGGERVSCASRGPTPDSGASSAGSASPPRPSRWSPWAPHSYLGLAHPPLGVWGSPELGGAAGVPLLGRCPGRSGKGRAGPRAGGPGLGRAGSLRGGHPKAVLGFCFWG